MQKTARRRRTAERKSIEREGRKVSRARATGDARFMRARQWPADAPMQSYALAAACVSYISIYTREYPIHSLTRVHVSSSLLRVM